MRSPGRTIVVALVVAGGLLGGCSTALQPAWSKPGVDRQDASRDAADCERQARHDPTHGQEQGFFGFSIPRNERVFDACMRARGYRPAA